MLCKPEFEIGECVVVPLKDDSSIRYIGRILNGIFLVKDDGTSDGWHYRVLLDEENKYIESYEEHEITKYAIIKNA
jgi:hypothetical protein